MTPYVLDDAGTPNCFSDGLLDDRRMHVMAPLLARLRILPAILQREDPLPPPVARGIGVLAVKGHRHHDTAPAIGEVLFVDCLDILA